MGTKTDIEKRIAKAAKTMGKAVARLHREDPEIANRLSAALAAEVERIRRGE